MESTGDRTPEERDPSAETRAFLKYVLIPAWIVPGWLDWYWHRATKIECNAGAYESLTHLLMEAEAGVGIALGLFFEIDAGVIAAIAAAALIHEATVVWDVSYAAPRRPVTQREQHTHSFLEVLPFVTAAFAGFMHHRQARALVGLGAERPRFAFRVDRRALTRSTIAIFALSAAAGALPYVEEMLRCLRTKPTIAPRPVPDNRPGGTAARGDRNRGSTKP